MWDIPYSLHVLSLSLTCLASCIAEMMIISSAPPPDRRPLDFTSVVRELMAMSTLEGVAPGGGVWSELCAWGRGLVGGGRGLEGTAVGGLIEYWSLLECYRITHGHSQ